MSDSFLKKWFRFLVYLSVAALVITGFRRYVFCIYHVEGVSMEPSYEKGRVVFCSRLSSFDRFDVVAVHLTKDGFGKTAIKRVVGIPGDTVCIRDGVLYINGEPEQMKGYCVKGVMEDMEPLVLGDDEYFVLGDNREDSYDSRTVGPVKKGDFRGKILN